MSRYVSLFIKLIKIQNNDESNYIKNKTIEQFIVNEFYDTKIENKTRNDLT